MNTPQHGAYERLSALINNLNATLANLDFVHQSEVNRILSGEGDLKIKEVAKQTLEARHRERRMPYVETLAELRAQITSRRRAN